MFKRSLAYVAGVGAVLAPVVSHAAITLPTAMNTADVESLEGIILTSLAVIWSIRKLIKMSNRS